MNAREINLRLADRALEVCQYLLPHGRQYGRQWKAGDIHGSEASNKHRGGSLVVDIDGPTVGRFKDFDASQDVSGGTFLDLWMACRTNGDFKEALNQAANWLGIDLNRQVARVKAGSRGLPGSEKKPAALDRMYHPVREGSEVWKWLTETRKISADAIRAFRVGETSFEDKNGGEPWVCVVFPFFDEEGNLVRLKGRDIRDKARMYFYPRKDDGGQLMLWGKTAVRSGAGVLHITEGELDAMSAYDYGLSAVSVPNGAQGLTKDGRNPNDEWLERDHEWLERFDTIYLCLDADAAGKAAAAAIGPRLGRERLRMMEFPDQEKDFNGCLMGGLIGEEIEMLRDEAKHLDPEKLALPSHFRKQIWEEFFPVNGEEPGDSMPWAMPFRFRPGEVTVWHGYNGSGKTACMTYCMTWLAGKLGRKVCIASLEMPPKKTLKNAMRMGMGKPKPVDETEFNQMLRFMDEHFFMFNHVGEVSLEEILDVWKYACRKYGVQYLVLDSLMRCNVNEDDYDSQKGFMNRIVEFAAEYNVNVNVVCHTGKPDSRHPESKHWPDKRQINGSSHLTNLPHNVVCVWRNRAKQEGIERLNPRDEDYGLKLHELEQQPDSVFLVQKQRETGMEVTKHLFFDTSDEGHGGSWQYREDRLGKAERLWL